MEVYADLLLFFVLFGGTPALHDPESTSSLFHQRKVCYSELYNTERTVTQENGGLQVWTLNQFITFCVAEPNSLITEAEPWGFPIIQLSESEAG